MKNYYNDLLYNELNEKFKNTPEIDLMNHGYYPIDYRCSNLFMDSPASLYCYLINKFESVENKSILDIGCGRGGGIKVLRQHFNFSEVVGCDINQTNIDHCNLNPSNCKFVVDNAEKLENFKDNSFDLIINIESTHCYENLKDFFKSVKRVLKKDGQFIIADIFNPNLNVIEIMENLSGNYFNILEVENITENVKFSCKHTIEKIEKISHKNNGHFRLLEIFEEKYELYKKGKYSFIWFLMEPV